MRFYPGAHEYLHKVGWKNDIFDQFLFLVADVKNEHDIHAVSLHNGKQKLGSVAATESPYLRSLFNKWNDGGPKGDYVIVCKLDRIASSLSDFKFAGSIKVHAKYRVNERLARKYADKYRQKD